MLQFWSSYSPIWLQIVPISHSPGLYSSLSVDSNYRYPNPCCWIKLLPPIMGVSPRLLFRCFGWRCLAVAGFAIHYCWIRVEDDLISATQSVCVSAVFLAFFVLYLLRRSLLRSAVAIRLLGLFYPHYVFVSNKECDHSLCAKNGRLHPRNQAWLSAMTGLGIAL